MLPRNRDQGQIFIKIIKDFETFRVTKKISKNEAQVLWESAKLVQKRRKEDDTKNEDEVYETDQSFVSNILKMLFEFEPRAVSAATTSDTFV